MLEPIWQLIRNFGVDTVEIANAIHYLIEPVIDADGLVVGYKGILASLVNIPVIGEFLKGFAELAPEIATTTESMS